MINIPSRPLIAVRSVPLLTLCAVILTSASGCLLTESRVTPRTPPNSPCPEAGIASATIWNAMQAGTRAEASKLRVIDVLSETDATIVSSQGPDAQNVARGGPPG